jgi:SAM-dependent methyltransferase
MSLARDQIYAHTQRLMKFPSGMKVYNLGSGFQKYDGVIGVDIGRSADIKHNLNVTPWPIADNSADVCTAFHSFEHLDSIVATMNEVHRILKPGGRLIIEVPFYRSPTAFQDPTHTIFFAASSMIYFCNPLYAYTDKLFKQIYFSYGWCSSNRMSSRLFKKFIHRYPRFYDKFLSIFFPVRIIIFELEPIK